MTGPEHYKQAAYYLASAEEDMRQGRAAEGGGAFSDLRARRISVVLQAAALHVQMAEVAATVQTGRMAPQAAREWEAVLVVPANFAEARGESW